MSEAPGFSAHDRVLVFAPHPDDESIATGGLLQIARASGAACRVVVVTDGDNNPWPQRWIEKRWRIDAAARARWGMRRRGEAQAAMDVLGFDERSLCFLGQPDMGITDRLMSADRDFESQLASQIDEFQPTLVALPAMGDRHPDHNALHIALRLVLARGHAIAPRLLAFAVHGAGMPVHPIELSLSTAQRETKARAILAHASQMRLSARRFLAYARACEAFDDQQSPPLPDPDHPLTATVSAGRIDVQIHPRIWEKTRRRQATMRVVLDGASEKLRGTMTIPPSAGNASIFASTGDVVATAKFSQPNALTIEIPSQLGPLRQGFLKLGRAEPGIFVLDRFGWQAVSGDASPDVR